MERKLASIKLVRDLKPIENKDRIELAIVDGWSVIVKKDDYAIGDKTVFVEIDSILPDKPEFAFLKRNGDAKYLRIKTLKMSGVLSQGICFPLSILPKGNYALEQNVTDIIGITKYERYEQEWIDTSTPKKQRSPFMKFLLRFGIFRKMFGNSKERRDFPSFIDRTDETRLQNIPHILENKDIKYEVREKLDGSSATYVLKKNKSWFGLKTSYDFIVCSRNLRLYNKNDVHGIWFCAEKYNIKAILQSFIGDNEWVCFQGEVVSPKNQGNKYKVSEPRLYLFNLIYPSGKVSPGYVPRFDLQWCPIIEKEFTLKDTVEEMLEYATAKSKINNDVLREGVVLRNYEKGISFKVVSPDFLLKNDE